MGVPFAGKYKEILNSDSVKFGGTGATNPRVKASKKEEWDAREHSISITLPPLGICVFQCTPVKEEPKKETGKKAAGKKETDEEARKRTAGEKPAAAKKPSRTPGPVEAAGKKAADALDRISQKVGGLIKKTAQSGGQQENKESVHKEER